MALTPSYQNLTISDHFQLTAANTALDGTGALITLHSCPAQSKGSLIEQIVLNRPSTTPGTLLDLHLFIDDGTSIRYFDSIPLALDAMAQTIKFYGSTTFSLSLSPGQILKGALTVAEAVNVFVSGGIY